MASSKKGATGLKPVRSMEISIGPTKLPESASNEGWRLAVGGMEGGGIDLFRVGGEDISCPHSELIPFKIVKEEEE